MIDMKDLKFNIDVSHAEVNMEEISINSALPAEEKKLAYLEQVQNLYCFLCGETPVTICFAQNGVKLGEKIKSYFLRRRR